MPSKRYEEEVECSIIEAFPPPPENLRKAPSSSSNKGDFEHCSLKDEEGEPATHEYKEPTEVKDALPEDEDDDGFQDFQEAPALGQPCVEEGGSSEGNTKIDFELT
eukprot:CAMPEP_0170509974 /NCGR_PEP_ID=MMETSP0208-20121228/65505_1 /TAXON_ID=197538 /ORGANISM="Strombidium inclinatum, Strain S3" /LENGTH=105 /DNA_ID=CAMNT_0010793387 /DNA_START=4292 /DNA_END=4609 /DNA_ORIENTATION=-